MEKTATLVVNGKTYELPLIVGTEGEIALDISCLRSETGLITLDPGYANTGSCKSTITFMDGERGILRYRGYPVEQLAEYSSFRETAYLLINGELPLEKELNHFSVMLNDHSLVHEDMRIFFEKFPRRAHPMGILSSMVNALRAFYPEIPERSEEEEINITFARLLSKVRTLAAVSYKISRGHKVVYPRHSLSYCANFLNMMFDSPVKPYVIDEDLVDALNVFWILHADHEQNCSTSAVRVVGSARANLFSSVSAGVCALWGPLHGGANAGVIAMLEDIHNSGRPAQYYIDRAKDKDDPFRLMGFGHRVYKNFDPRSLILKQQVHDLLQTLEHDDDLLKIAMKLEEVTLQDDYFISRNLYPNVDFYSGLLLRAIGIPLNMYTVMFAIGRMPGWIANWQEMHEHKLRISRPRQIYTGKTARPFIPLAER